MGLDRPRFLLLVPITVDQTTMVNTERSERVARTHDRTATLVLRLQYDEP